MTLLVNSTPINNLKLSDKDRRDRISVFIIPCNNDKLCVRLSIAFDTNLPAEYIMSSFGKNTTDCHQIEYTVSMAFKGEKQQLRSLIKGIYGKKDRENKDNILRSPNLVKLSIDKLNEILTPIAIVGASMFHRLFLDTSIKFQNLSSNLGQAIRTAIISAFNRANIISITIDNYDTTNTDIGYLFPWSFLYDDISFDGSDRSKLDPKKFWGFKYELQTDIKHTTSAINLPPSPKILTAICPNVDTNHWHSATDHPFTNYSENIKTICSIGDLGTALANFQEDCFYFFGHAYHNNNSTPTQSWLKLLGQELTVDKLNRIYHAPHFEKEPVLGFFNGCDTTPLEEWNESTIVGFLCQRSDKRLCCITTVAEIPDVFAAEFAKHFWVEFLQNKTTIGTAILLARKKMLEDWNNPLGLLYSLFGYVDTKIQQNIGA